LYKNLVAGIGIYEKGLYPRELAGKRVYSTWSGLLNRCYGIKTGIKNQSYKGCSVHPDFIKFQDFAAWACKQVGFDKEGWHLDKDILVPGNKVYGPDTCCYVPTQINSLIIKPTLPDDLPVGITYYKPTNRYVASIGISGTRKYLGCSNSIDELMPLYQAAKSEYIIQVANQWKDQIGWRVYVALIELADNILGKYVGRKIVDSEFLQQRFLIRR